MKVIKTFLLISFILPFRVYSQWAGVLFSVTGDTVCFSNPILTNDSVNYHKVFVQRQDNIIGQTISVFTITCAPKNCLANISPDTIKKYHLKFKGEEIDARKNKDFNISVKPTNTHTVNIPSSGDWRVFETTVIVNVSCKGQNLYSNTFNLMFSAKDASEFSEADIVRPDVWRKKNSKKYVVALAVKEHQIYTGQQWKPDDTEFKYFLFII